MICSVYFLNDQRNLKEIEQGETEKYWHEEQRAEAPQKASGKPRRNKQ